MLACSLHSYKIDEAPQYYAISYAWGPRNLTRGILCDGQRLKVSPHLLAGLRSIRALYGSHMCLWVDAICIQQDNNKEKAALVRNMDNIFRDAMAVLVWLGREANRSKLAMQFIPRLLECLKHATGLVVPDRRSLHELGLPRRIDPVWLALGYLQLRRWFRRVWIIQEIGVAQNATVICGREQLPFQMFIDLENGLRDTTLDTLLPRGMAAREKRLFARYTWDAVLYAHEMKQNKRLAWTELFHFAGGLLCKERVDRVYGLLGLVPEHFRRELEPDSNAYEQYELNRYWRLFIRTAHLALRSDKTLRLLHAVPYEHSSKRIPSWCPDFSVPLGYQNVLSEGANPLHLVDDSPQQYILYKAGISEKHRMSRIVHARSEVDPFINVTGIDVDEILSTIPMYQWKRPISIRAVGRKEEVHMSPYAGRALDLLERCSKHAWAALSPSICIEALADTLVGYQPGDSIPTGFSLRVPFERIMAELHNQQEIEVGHMPGIPVTDWEPQLWYLEEMANMCANRVFFTTKNGRIGVGSRLVEPGDRVTILFGGRAAYILRKYHGRQSWRFMHAAYVHGLMRGEVFSMLDRGEVESRSFTLE